MVATAGSRARHSRSEEAFRTKTLTCVRNNRGIDVAKLVRDLRVKHHLVIDGGYGRIKGETFQIGGGFPHKDAHLRPKQPRDRRGEASSRSPRETPPRH